MPAPPAGSQPPAMRVPSVSAVPTMIRWACVG